MQQLVVNCSSIGLILKVLVSINEFNIVECLATGLSPSILMGEQGDGEVHELSECDAELGMHLLTGGLPRDVSP